MIDVLSDLFVPTPPGAQSLAPRPSDATFYAWKAKFGGMAVSEAKRLKQLTDENSKLKRLLPMLDNVALKNLLAKKF